MAGSIKLYGTTGYLELVPPSSPGDVTLTLPTDSIQPGLILLTSQTFSSSSSVSVNNCFTSSYKYYRIIFDVNSSSSNTNSIRLRLRSNFTDSTTAYNYSILYSGWNNTPVASGASSTTGVETNYVTTSSNGDVSTTFDVISPYLPRRTTFNGVGTGDGSSFFLSARHNVSSSYDGITFYTSSGTITGTVKIYGYRD